MFFACRDRSTGRVPQLNANVANTRFPKKSTSRGWTALLMGDTLVVQLWSHSPASYVVHLVPRITAVGQVPYNTVQGSGPLHFRKKGVGLKYHTKCCGDNPRSVTQHQGTIEGASWNTKLSCWSMSEI